VTFNLLNASVAVLFVVGCLLRSGVPDHGATGALVVVELLGLLVGAVGVRLGGSLVRQFDQRNAEPTSFEGFGPPSSSVAGGFGRRPSR
jgi:hypothetical protein